MMVGAEAGPQTYKFFKHEFKAINPKEKSYTFTMEVVDGKATDSLKLSNIAKDLLSVLITSPKATELMEANAYEFILDKQFVFHVKKIEREHEEQGVDGAESENKTRESQ